MMLLAGVIIASCQNLEDTPDDTYQLGEDAIRFCPSIAGISRATDTSFDNGDAISVFAVESTSSNTNGLFGNGDLYATNSRYICSNQNFSATDNGIQFPSSDSKLGFHAIYPYNANIAVSKLPLYEFSVNKKQNEGTNYTKSDLMIAYTLSDSKDIVPLTFSHKMCKVIINLNTESLPVGTPSIVLNSVLTSVRANLNLNTFQSYGESTDLTMATNGTLSFKCVLPPQTVYKDKVLAAIVIGGYNYNWILEKTIEWKSGIEYTYNLKFSRAAVRFYSDIVPWGHLETIDDVVPPEMQEIIKPYISIYKGNNPPKVEGSYLCNVSTLVYSSDGGFAPGEVFIDTYFKFSNQDMINNTLDYEEKQGSSHASGPGSFISGEGDNFTAYFNTVGESLGIYVKTAIVISGTWSVSGVKNYRYAFVMLEKGSDPDNKLVNVGTFRVFKDSNELASKASWPSNAPAMKGITYKKFRDIQNILWINESLNK